MQTPTLVALTATLAAAVGAGTHAVLSPAATHASDPAGARALAPSELDALRAEVRDLTARLEEVASARPLQGPTPGVRASATELEALVREILAEQAGPERPAAEPVASGARAQLPTADLLDLLLGGELDHGQVDQLWQELREAGRTDEVLAAIRAWAAEDEADPERQLELGKALLAKVQEVGNGPMAGMYAMQADGSFDRALELDPQNWEARFTKALALSFWPPSLGKQGAAIQQFELLVQQQAGLAPQPHHAQAHLFLGNVYQQIGSHDKAMAAWQAGLEIFPDDAALQEQVDLAGGQ